MKKWEYKRVYEEVALNAYGEEGWELVSSKREFVPGIVPFVEYEYIFKREKKD